MLRSLPDQEETEKLIFLEEDIKKIIELRENHSYKEIAEIMGRSESSIRNKMFKLGETKKTTRWNKNLFIKELKNNLKRNIFYYLIFEAQRKM